MNPGRTAPSGGERVLFASLPPAGPGHDVTQELDHYRSWVKHREGERLARRSVERLNDVRISVLVLADGESLVKHSDRLRRSVVALARQTDRAFDICIGIYGSEPGGPQTSVAMAEVAQLGGRGNVPQISSCTPTEDAPRAASAALQQASGDLVLLLDAGDEMAPDALELLRNGMEEEVDLVYGDHDTLQPDGQVVDPQLKPSWSPELLLGSPYLGKPVLIRRSLLLGAGGYRPLPDGDWRHDILLRLAEHVRSVRHIPEVLCHLAARETTPTIHGSAAVDEALRRRGELGSAVPNSISGCWSVRRSLPRRTKVGAIIPFRDAPRFLRTCADTVIATVDPSRTELEIVLIDNGSVEPETRSLIEYLAMRADIRVLSDNAPFNWASLSNMGASTCDCDVLLFLNNDIEVHRFGWLEALAAQAIRADVGAVGARLLYPTGQVQHVGMVIGLGGAAGHILTGLPAHTPGYLGMAVQQRECTAVTGACLATRREVFESLNGFDETLGLDLNDVDYCLRAARKGYRVLCEPRAELIHHESPSRGTSGNASNIRQFLDRWEDVIEMGDPFLHPAITRVDSSCGLRRPGEEEWWLNWRATLPR